MTPDELRVVIQGKLFADFIAKVGHDIISIIRRDEDIFFGKTLPTGFAMHMSLEALSGVIHAILKGGIGAGTMKQEEVDNILHTVTRSIKSGL